MEDPRPPATTADLQTRLERAAAKVEVDDLVRRGRRSVLVLHVSQVEALIREAVERTLAGGGGSAPAAEVARVEAEAKRRFDELMARHREVLRLKEQTEEALRDLAVRLSNGEAAGSGPDLQALSRQVAAMGSLLRGESPAAKAADRPLLDLLQAIAGPRAGAGDDRLDRILLQVERLASAVEATERALRHVRPAGAGDSGGESAVDPASTASGEIFRAILEENLKLADPQSAPGRKP
jgi:hypothetical protein